MLKKRKIIIIVAFCLLLVATGTINILLNNYATSEVANNQVVTAGTFFSNYRTSRTSTRDQEIIYLNAIIESTASSTEAINNAEIQKMALISQMESEVVMEGLIKAKGFEDSVVSLINGSISVIVKSAELNKSEVAQIVEVVQKQTGYDIDNIRIIPVE